MFHAINKCVSLLAGIFRTIIDIWRDGHCSVELETNGAGCHLVGIKSLG